MERYKSVSQIAEMTGFDRRTIKTRIQGLIIQKTHGKAEYYDMHEVLPRLYQSGQDKDINKKLLDEQLRYEQARADKMILEVDERRGELIPVNDVASAVASEYTSVRARILSIPSRCAMDLSIESNPAKIKDRLNEEINEALSELVADKKYEESLNVVQPETIVIENSQEDAQAPTES